MPELALLPMTAAHGQAVLAIYQEGLDSGLASFRQKAGSWQDWDRQHLAVCRWVALDDRETVLGWAALSPYSSRADYAGVAEVSIYVARARRGQGLGGRLLGQLIDSAEAAGLWTLQAGIFPENAASVGLHQAHGFRIVGCREKIGRSLAGPGPGPAPGRWRDVLLLERRSRIVGRD